MNNRFRFLFSFLALAVLVAGCNLPRAVPTPSSSQLSTMVQQTVDAIQALTPRGARTPLATPTSAVFTPMLTATSSLGEVSGRVCYRNDAMTQLTFYFTNTGTSVVSELTVYRPQSEYTIQLDPGTYEVYGWPLDYSIGVLHEGGTFQAVAGQKTTGVDVCDWSHGPFDVPYPPGFQPTARLGIVAGSISGYPYGSLPQLAVVAFSQDTPYYWYWAVTAAGQVYYTVTDLPPGDYQIIAYDDAGHAGGSPAIVTVIAGQTTNADISDWASGWPANPLK